MSFVDEFDQLPLRSLLEWAEGNSMANQEFLTQVDSPIYRLLGVRYLFSQPDKARKSYLPVPLPDFPVGYFRRPDALPRAFLWHDPSPTALTDDPA